MELERKQREHIPWTDVEPGDLMEFMGCLRFIVSIPQADGGDVGWAFGPCVLRPHLIDRHELLFPGTTYRIVQRLRDCEG